MRKGVIFFARTMNLLLLLLLGLFLCSLLPMAIPACTRARGSFWGCRQLMGRKHEVNNLDLWLSSSPTFVVRYYCGSSRLRTPPQKLALQFVILLLHSNSQSLCVICITNGNIMRQTGEKATIAALRRFWNAQNQAEFGTSQVDSSKIMVPWESSNLFESLLA